MVRKIFEFVNRKIRIINFEGKILDTFLKKTTNSDCFLNPGQKIANLILNIVIQINK